MLRIFVLLTAITLLFTNTSLAQQDNAICAGLADVEIEVDGGTLPDSILLVAVDSYAIEDYTIANQLLTRYLTDNAQHADAYLYRSCANYNLGRFMNAQDDLMIYLSLIAIDEASDTVLSSMEAMDIPTIDPDTDTASDNTLCANLAEVELELDAESLLDSVLLVVVDTYTMEDYSLANQLLTRYFVDTTETDAYLYSSCTNYNLGRFMNAYDDLMMYLSLIDIDEASDTVLLSMDVEMPSAESTETPDSDDDETESAGD